MNATDAFNAHEKTASALKWDPADESLSSGEGALARIVHAIAQDADLLDGAQLAAVAQALTAYAEHVQDEENESMNWLLSRAQSDSSQE